MSQNDKHCLSCCMLSLVRQYLNNIWRKCNWAASCMFGECAGSLIVWKTVPRNYFIIFFHSSRNLSFLFGIYNCTDGFIHLSNKEIKLETNIIGILMELRSVALKWFMTSPSYFNRLVVYSLRNSGVGFVCSNSALKWWQKVGSICLWMRLNKVC
jgi:hypothetical protein